MSYNSSAEYLNKVRQELASNRSPGKALQATLPEYIIPVTESISITDAVSTTTMTLGDYDVVDNTGKLVGFYPFDYSINDYSNANHGTMTGAETYVTGPLISATHKLRTGLDFDGSTQYLTLANESNFDFQYTNTFSVSFWIKMGTIASDMGIICKSLDLTTGVGWKIYFQNSGDNIVFTLADGTTAYTVTSTTSLNNANWYNVVCTYAGTSNRSGMKLYVNGTLEATGSSSVISSTILNNSSVVIGALSDGTSKLDASIDDVKIYNVELTSADVTRLAQGKQVNRDTTATNPAYLAMSDIL